MEEESGFIKVNKENFAEILKKYSLMVIEFRTAFCSPCMIMEREKLEPLINKLSRNYKKKVGFGKIIIDKNLELAQKFNVKSSMTFLFFKKGKLVDRFFGVKIKDVLEEKIKKLLS